MPQCEQYENSANEGEEIKWTIVSIITNFPLKLDYDENDCNLSIAIFIIISFYGKLEFHYQSLKSETTIIMSHFWWNIVLQSAQK